jgi:hypothetical protein
VDGVALHLHGCLYLYALCVVEVWEPGGGGFGAWRYWGLVLFVCLFDIGIRLGWVGWCFEACGWMDGWMGWMGGWESRARKRRQAGYRSDSIRFDSVQVEYMIGRSTNRNRNRE